MSAAETKTTMDDDELPPPTRESASGSGHPPSIGRRLYLFFASYGLATACFLCMLVLTLLGTLEQQHQGIQEVTAKYFTSFGLIHDMRIPAPGGGTFTLPIPLPGGYLCMALLFVNLTLGAMVRIRKDWRRAPMLVTHFSILVLLAGGWITHHFAIDGAMQVFEGKESNYFADFSKWDVMVEKWGDGSEVPDSAIVLPYEQLKVVKGGSRRVFAPKDLPFEVEITNFLPNSVPGYRRAGVSGASGEPTAYDGFFLAGLELEKEAERNIPGMEFRAVAPGGKGDELAKGLLWGLARDPFSFKLGDAHWVFRLEKRLYPVPFTIALDRFVKEEHPGISMAKSFESYVRKIENGVEEEVHIYMNHPLRHEGYTFFQHSFGQGESTAIGGATYSVFAVWKNPADKWPLYSCVLVAVGLLAHFVMKLVFFLNRAGKKPARPAESSAPEPEAAS